jgi:hypothetical protein
MNNHAGKRCSANQSQRQFGQHHRTAKHYGGNGVRLQPTVRCPGHPALIPEHYIQALVGGNSLWANFFASIVGALMYFATLTEVPIQENCCLLLNRGGSFDDCRRGIRVVGRLSIIAVY